MFKTKDLSTTGTVNLSHAYGAASAQPDAERRRASLRALKKQLEGALGIDDLATENQVQVFEIRTRLRAYLLGQDLSEAYVRNQSSTLNFVLRHGTILGGAQDFGDWGPVIDLAITAIRERTPQEKVVRNLSRAQKYMISFFAKAEISRASFASEIHLKAYRKFLAEDCKLNPEGNGRLVLQASKSILNEIGVALESPKILSPLPLKFQKAIDIMGEYATKTNHKRSSKAGPVDDPFADTTDYQVGKILPITWAAYRNDLERFLRFFQDREPSTFEQSALTDWINEDRLKEFLTDAYQNERFSVATAETYLSRLVQFIKYANATHTGGFELSEKELEITTKNLWALVGNIRKHFRKSTVNERLIKQGGVPKWEELHENFEESLISACRLIQRLQGKITTPKTPQVQTIELRIAIMLRDLILASFHLYAACRPQDTRETITTASLIRIAPEYYSLNYLPSKTSGKKKPSVVDMCLPLWMTPVIEIYLDKYRRLIYKDTELLFPADERLKRAHSNVAHPGPVRKGNANGAFARLTKKYFGKAVGATMMRYSLGNFFDSHDLGGLYLFMGHQPDQSMTKFTRIEHEHYLRKDDSERVKIAKRHYEVVVELLKEPKKLEAALRKLK